MIVPEISLITYFKNRRACLGAYFRNLLIQQDVNYEVIAIDYCSTDDSLEYVKQFREEYKHLRLIKVLGNLGFNLSKARNIGCRNAIAPLCMTVDADIILLNKYSLKTILDVYNNFNKFICHFNSVINSLKPNYQDRGIICYCGGGNMIFHKSLYKRAGGFPNWIKNHGMEDYIFRLRAENVGGQVLRFPGQHTYKIVKTIGPTLRDFETKEVIEANREGYIPCESIWEDPKQNAKNVFNQRLKDGTLYDHKDEKLPDYSRLPCLD